MNNFGNGFGITGVQGIVQGDGLLCSPNPITRNGVISLSPAIAASITSLSTKTQHITADGDRTQIDGTLVIHGPFLGQGDIGTSESPFSTVYVGNVITPSTNLSALATTVSNHTSSIIELQKGPMTLLDLQENILYHFDSELVLAQQTFTVPVTLKIDLNLTYKWVNCTRASRFLLHIADSVFQCGVSDSISPYLNHIEKVLMVDTTDFKVFLTKDGTDANDTFELQKFSFIKVSIV